MNTEFIENEEIEEIENVEEDVVETPEETEKNGNGALVSGIIGGILAYAAISGGRKLFKYARAKRRERKLAKKEAKDDIVDVEYAEVENEDESECDEKR